MVLIGGNRSGGGDNVAIGRRVVDDWVGMERVFVTNYLDIVYN